jgi:hypothetical protein
VQVSWDGIVFDVALLEDWGREAVFDQAGVDFLYWHDVLDVVVTVGGEHNNRERFPPFEADNTWEITDAKDTFQFDRARNQYPHVSPNGRRRFKDMGLGRKGPSDLGGVLAVRPLVVANAIAPFPGRNFEKLKAPNTLPWTDQEVRRRLQLPRRQLLVWTYSGPLGEPEFLLASPLTGVETDCRHGPVCTVLALPRIHGNSSGVFRLRFETWTRPLDESYGRIGPADGPVTLAQIKDGAAIHKKLLAAPAMISNRWKMRSQPDPESGLNVTVIDGTAVFRMDVLKVQRVTPDQLRGHFMHPIPAGHMRLPPQVEVSPTGDAVAYQIVDQEVMTNFPAGQKYGMTNIEIVQNVQYTSPHSWF